MHLKLWRNQKEVSVAETQGGVGEHLTLGWPHLPQSLPSVWTLGPLGKVSVQGDTLTPCPPVLTASRILVLSGNKFQLIAALALQTQPAASYTRTPASQPIPQPRPQHPLQPQPRSQGSSFPKEL